MIRFILGFAVLVVLTGICTPCRAENVALGADVTYFEGPIYGSFPALVDGDYATGCQTRGALASYEFDIHTPATVDTMHFEGYSALYLFLEYKLSGKVASHDDWTELLYVTGNTEVSRTDTFEAFRGQYFQFWLDCSFQGPYWMEFELHDVPEPSTFALAAFALLSLAFYGWRRKR